MIIWKSQCYQLNEKRKPAPLSLKALLRPRRLTSFVKSFKMSVNFRWKKTKTISFFVFHPLINIWNWLPCFLWQHEKRSKCSNPPDLVSQYIIFTSLEEKRGVTTTTFSEQDFSFFKGISGLRVRDFWFRNFQTFLRSDLPLEEKYATNYSTTTKGLQVNPFSFPYVSQNAVWSHLTGPCSSRD